ncbi:LL-diaminopimelate aminotransferase [Candidatus Daviesbacteria bacterium RIFCSPHIGHO2_02_FULL_41_10]|uniref:LL-diaminopimelate aminotransferase n=2 Tax=Candidatus Daviesiibacteriota TaxID=1752718 RepID=A0A1F5ISD9_9BACT|nr:MAG: LL-diaminopimelate aminotransferase [Candidatus Daviesbacteria bacterium RIFCSPHIGHO2_01_FULL_41_23]OGE33298.1 MAG: LL-diaminopimelate aminotransferase [Candidatus Daviesbacteria bacterium RIFCSPHIGHO2_02_FULL_41_10]
MATINANYNKLQSSYLFSEIAKRTKTFLEKNPGVQIMKLGIGNTTQPLTPFIVKGLKLGVKKLTDAKTYTGYGDEQGDSRLRTELAKYYQKRDINLEPQEIFVSDGAKPDCANISSIFGDDSIVAIADPVYPVYVDSNIIAGKKLLFMECNEKNGFIPDPPNIKVDLIFICSPNNPTGAVATKMQLKAFVDYALKNKAVIIFDGAYGEYIQDLGLPRSIYEIPGAKKCAIEINSFSKWAGFTGVRLGWTVVPMELIVEGGEKGKVNNLWNRRQTTMFNGASNIAQEGGLAVLSEKGQKECKKLISYYMDNARLIKKGLVRLGLGVFGGENAPYIWVKTPNEMSSWEFFDKLLREAHVVGTPGSGFGSQGEGYLRLSAFGHKQDVEKAVESIQNNLVIAKNNNI